MPLWLQVACALFAGGHIATLNGAESSARFGVSATVLAEASLRLEAAPGELDVSAQDISRGFIDMTEPVRVRVASNSPDGFVLDIWPVGSMLAALGVHGVGGDIRFGAEGGTIVQRWQHAQSMSLNLSFRFVLAPGLVPGRYPYPLRITARALDSAAAYPTGERQ
jgi:hypothetical protein